MILATYINDLLFRYNCVIVPDFGGFVTNKIGAQKDTNTHVFYPPTKQITFNSYLQHNDGLLANYIASAENISYQKALDVISLTVIKWQNELQNSSVEIKNVGVLRLNIEKQIVFEPNSNSNYLTESFGLTTVQSAVIARKKLIVKPFVPVVKKEEKNKIPTFIKYAATAAILITLGYTGFTSYQQNKQIVTLESQEKEIHKKIQEATFVITNPLPTIELQVVKEKSKPYHIIAGAFQFAENAEKKAQELIEKGFDSKIIGVNKWGLTQVTFNSYHNKNEAINNLYKIQNSISKDAWLLVAEQY